MAVRNRTVRFTKHRDYLNGMRAPLSSSAPGSGGPVTEMANVSLLGLGSNRSAYAPLSTDDPGPSGCVCTSLTSCLLF